jgi:hypothetical protein
MRYTSAGKSTFRGGFMKQCWYLITIIFYCAVLQGMEQNSNHASPKNNSRSSKNGSSSGNSTPAGSPRSYPDLPVGSPTSRPLSRSLATLKDKILSLAEKDDSPRNHKTSSPPSETELMKKFQDFLPEQDPELYIRELLAANNLKVKTTQLELLNTSFNRHFAAAQMALEQIVLYDKEPLENKTDVRNTRIQQVFNEYLRAKYAAKSVFYVKERLESGKECYLCKFKADLATNMLESQGRFDPTSFVHIFKT